MSLQSRIATLITAIGADIKALKAITGTREFRTTTYTNATVTGTDVFTGFTPAANKRYLIEAKLIVQGVAATNGIQTALLGPSTGLTRASVKIVSSDTATAPKTDFLALNAYQVALNTLTTPTIIEIVAIVETGASPGAGNIRVAARAESAAANAVQIFAGSHMVWTEV